jgi:hypothetical protein
MDTPGIYRMAFNRPRMMNCTPTAIRIKPKIRVSRAASVSRRILVSGEAKERMINTRILLIRINPPAISKAWGEIPK